MPVYEYECKKCGRIFEADQRIVELPLKSCRLCGGNVERLISRCSFVLKGDGWYVTEHPSKERKKAMQKGEKVETKKSTKEIQGNSTTEKKSKIVKASPAASSSSV